jgi:ribosomal protein S18 acetylase RimI-like enzyme
MSRKIEQATVEDAEEILALQKLAYMSEAEIYGVYNIPPLTQTLEEIRGDFERRLFLKVAREGIIVGSVRAHMDEGTCFIGRLIVHPDFQNQGIGTRLLCEIERRFGQAGRYELFTGHRSERNLYLYRKQGYVVFKSERITDALTLVFLEKRGAVVSRYANEASRPGRQ